MRSAIDDGPRFVVVRQVGVVDLAVESELQFGSSDEESKKFLHEFYKQAIPADAIARAVLFAIEQPGDVDVNEIIVRPTQEEF